MSGSYFLDSNILMYLFDRREPGKQERARELVRRALADRAGIISYQVVQETLNVITTKLDTAASAEDADAFLSAVLDPFCAVFPSMELYHKALRIKARWRFSFSDALIVAAALSSSCGILYSEDLQDGQVIDGLVVRNPFPPSVE
jgi:predicted nucleic acid-binding protein